jgi:hypothetical protein
MTGKIHHGNTGKSKSAAYRAKISDSVKRTLARKNRRIRKALDLLDRYEKQNGVLVDPPEVR